MPRSSTTAGQNHSGSSIERRDELAVVVDAVAPHEPRRRSRARASPHRASRRSRHVPRAYSSAQNRHTGTDRNSYPDRLHELVLANSEAHASAHRRPPLRRGEPQVVDARRRLLRAVHDHARQHGRERRAAVDPARPRRRPRRSSSGSSTGYALTFAALMLTGGKLADLLRPPAASSSSASAIFTLASLACGLAHERRVPDRRTHRPGRRRGAHEPRDALDHHRDVPAAPARDGDRHLGGRLGARARDRPARRRPAHRARRLELDLLRQRPGRHPRASSSACCVIDESQGHVARAAPRPARPRDVGRRPLRAHVRADRGEHVRLDVGAHPRRRSPSPRSSLVGVRPARAAPAAADARPVALPQRDLRRREHRRCCSSRSRCSASSSSSRSTCRTSSATRPSRPAPRSCR